MIRYLDLRELGVPGVPVADLTASVPTQPTPDGLGSNLRRLIFFHTGSSLSINVAAEGVACGLLTGQPVSQVAEERGEAERDVSARARNPQ